jgi:hypothetical protein
MKKFIVLTILAFALATGPEVAMAFDTSPALSDGAGF